MRQVIDLCDRIVVWRRGRICANLRKEETDGQDVVAYITGAKTQAGVRRAGLTMARDGRREGAARKLHTEPDGHVMKLGLVGYGFGGRYFHAPFIQAAGGVEIAGIVARAPGTVEAALADLPGVPVHASLTDMIAAGGIDAVTITTPPATRVALVLEAIADGLHVVADKPFAFHAEDARRMARAAKARGVVLSVFQNRRWTPICARSRS